MHNKASLNKQLGQGMTEYIVIVALIAVAAIAAFQFFGQTIRSQTSAIAHEVAGQDGSIAISAAGTAAGNTDKQRDAKGLAQFGSAKDVNGAGGGSGGAGN